MKNVKEMRCLVEECFKSWVVTWYIVIFFYYFWHRASFRIVLNGSPNLINLEVWLSNGIASKILKTTVYCTNITCGIGVNRCLKSGPKLPRVFSLETMNPFWLEFSSMQAWGCHSLVRLAGFLSVIFQPGSRDDKVMHSRSPEIGLNALPTQILSWVHHEEPLNPIGLLFAFK